MENNSNSCWPIREHIADALTGQTCGVSSIGNRDLLIKSGVYELNDPTKDFAADFRHLTACVRAREGEFLLGVAGTNDGLFAAPSIDMTTMDPALVQRWKVRFEHALDEEANDSSKNAKAQL